MSPAADMSEEQAAARLEPRPADSARRLDPAAAWLALRTSSAAPSRIGSMLELDGYLTGVLVAPSLIAPSRWIFGIWGHDEPVFDDEQRLTAALRPLVARYNTLSAEIEAGRQRLEAERVCDWRPVFLPADGKPGHAAVRQWAEGFWTAATLDPAGWSAYLDDERTRVILTPLAGFAPFGHEFDPADNIDELLDAAAAAIPRSVLLLRMIAAMRAERPSQRVSHPSRPRIGRNDPCPCGSGRKYKRCCGGD
ncbi:MAG TPA: UPF0149 family protein [Caulobacteraceae bacterium]|nr:UPF0149 family protein [Caulobacteraceae bacterium]